MKKIMSMFVLCLALSMALVSASGASDSMIVKVNVLETSVGVSVPEEIVFEDIAKGYISDRQDIEIVNTGTTDISVTPELASNYSDDIFNNLAFQQVLSEPLATIRYFDFDIEKPSSVGGTKTEGVYMYLDLSEYSGDVDEEKLDHSTEVIFWATAK